MEIEKALKELDEIINDVRKVRSHIANLKRAADLMYDNGYAPKIAEGFERLAGILKTCTIADE